MSEEKQASEDEQPPVSAMVVEARSYEMDAYGHMNQATAVQWFEHGRLAYLMERGLDYLSIPRDYGLHVMVLRQDITYRAQVLCTETFDMTSRIVRFGRTSFTWEHELLPTAGGESAINATVTMVCVGADGTSSPMPGDLRERLSA
jgi:YbgC/YbaW family acyl-CoA thioester hydrolase